MKPTKRAFRAAAVLVAAATAFLAIGSGQASSRMVASFDPPQLPESVAVDSVGNIYASGLSTGRVVKIAPDGTQSVLATFNVGQRGVVLGVAAEARGTGVLAVVNTGNAEGTDTHGIWSIGPDGTKWIAWAMPVPSAPNDILPAADGSFLVTNPAAGEVWVVEANGSASKWATGEALHGDATGCTPGHPAGALGANGITWGPDDSVLVSNTSKGTIVRVPINADGSAGEPSVWAGPDCSLLLGADGITADGRGGAFVANNFRNLILDVAPNGSIRTLATAADGLDAPSSVKYWAGRLVVSNFAAPALRAKDAGPQRPGIVSIDLSSGDPSNPIMLAPGMPAAGTVPAGGRGDRSFKYFAFDYAGDMSTASIGLRVTPEDQTAFNNDLIGFNVYGPQSGTTYAVGGVQPGLGAGSPNIAADVNTSARGRYVIQVFNYSGRDFDFQVWVKGTGVSAPRG